MTRQVTTTDIPTQNVAEPLQWRHSYIHITMWWSGSAHRQQNVDGNTNNIDASWNVRNWKCLLMSTKMPTVDMSNSTVAPTSIPGDEVIPIRKSTIYMVKIHWYDGFICMMLASVGISCCRVSFCLSVTSPCSTETAEHRIMQTTPHDSPGTLVFWCRKSRQKLKLLWRRQMQVR